MRSTFKLIPDALSHRELFAGVLGRVYRAFQEQRGVLLTLATVGARKWTRRQMALPKQGVPVAYLKVPMGWWSRYTDKD